MAIGTVASKLLVTILIIIAGFIMARIGSSIILKIAKRKNMVRVRHIHIIKIYRYIILITTILLALLFLRVDVGNDITILENLLSNILNVIPNILFIILLLILAVAIVNLVTFGLTRIFDLTGITDFMLEQKREHFLHGILVFVRFSLYIFTALFLLNLFGVDVSAITSVITWLLYGLLILFFLYVFFGTRSFVENSIASIYLKTTGNFKIGQKIKTDDVAGTITKISNQGVTIKSEQGYATFIPTREFVRKEISYKNVETDLDTLERIKSYYVEQKPSYCGPASASMILRIFGFNASQSRIGELSNTKVGTNEKPAGTKPNILINVVQELTKDKVKGAWITVENITDLRNEIRLWLNQGGLVIVDYKKSILFPDSKKAHYAVCVAVEGDELVILDPSFKTGGVYLADADKLYQGMNTYSSFLKSKRGYMIFAPEGTTAYHRIEEGLIYSDPSLYHNLSNKLKTELFKLTEKSQMLETVLPLRVKNFIRKWREKDRISRLWKPDTTY